MRTLDQWLDKYAESHQNPTNKLVHKICVPIITFTVFGLFWCIPVPSNLAIHPFANWSTLFGILALSFYLKLNLKLFFVMLLQVIGYLTLCHYVNLNANLLLISIVLFVLAWIGQFWGHKVEGKKPSFFEDLQFLLIGPIWVVKAITGFPKLKTE